MTTEMAPGQRAPRRRTMANPKVNNIVLVHGGFVDGSGWQNVYAILKNMGFNVSIVQNPTTSLADDVVATNRVIDVQDGPVVLAGHSYGGVVITEAGNNPKVARLAYITAFAPDNGRVGYGDRRCTTAYRGDCSKLRGQPGQ